MKTLVFRLFFCLSFSLTVLPVSASEEALQLLERMQSAVNSLSYQGKLVYQQNNDLATFRISHSAQQGGEESFVLVDPKTGKDIEGEGSKQSRFSLKTFHTLQPQSQEAYSFDLGGLETVSDIACQVLVARPKDSMRYLHRYCIDPESGMLLKYSVMDRGKQLVEQLLFTELKITDVNDTELVKQLAPSLQANTANALSINAPEKAVDKAAEETNDWTFTKLPVGFQKAREFKTSDGQTQIIITDGMTSVSVFIDDKSDIKQADENASYSSGAMNILTQIRDHYMITLMGEVPESTLQTIRDALSPLIK